ncbi:helix-turn-helix domain-containing protein [Knoellia aerolata]|uniref:helix-turn-helix domain-containing protein n=1 Tax=Knoellia aerolata TaxID=442954 RepID=UPI0009FE3851
MAYPGRPVLEPVPRFRGTNTIRQTPEQRRVLVEFASREYAAGRSLRQIAELTGRTQAAIRRALDQAGVPRRGPGAPVLSARTAGARRD